MVIVSLTTGAAVEPTFATLNSTVFAAARFAAGVISSSDSDLLGAALSSVRVATSLIAALSFGLVPTGSLPRTILLLLSNSARRLSSSCLRLRFSISASVIAEIGVVTSLIPSGSTLGAALLDGR